MESKEKQKSADRIEAPPAYEQIQVEYNAEYVSPQLNRASSLSRQNSKKFGTTLRSSKNSLGSPKLTSSKTDLTQINGKLSGSKHDLHNNKYAKSEPTKLDHAQSASMLTLRDPPNREVKTYWSPLRDRACWRALFYFLFVNFAFGIFCFVWVLTTGIVSIGLLPLFLVGYPLLYASALSWRALAHIQSHLVFLKKEMDFELFKINVKPKTDKEKAAPLRIHIVDGKTWIAFGYFSFVKIFTAVWGFAVALVALVLVFSLTPLAPPLFTHLKGLWEGERDTVKNWFAA